jgi:hypothetical protein
VSLQLLVMHGDASCFPKATVEGQQRKLALELQLRGGAWQARELIGLHAGKLFTSQHE